MCHERVSSANPVIAKRYSHMGKVESTNEVGFISCESRATNLSGTNLNVGACDNGPKGVGQDARSNFAAAKYHERAKLCVPCNRKRLSL